MRQETHRNRCWRVFGIGLVLAIVVLLITLRAAAGPPDAEVLPPGVVVRQGPAQAAPGLAELPEGTQVEVLITQRGPGGDWAQVALPSGGTGFVPDQALRRLTKPPQWSAGRAGSNAPSIGRRMGESVLEIPLRRLGGVFLVSARINEQITTNFIVDTGSATVTINNALVDRLGIGYSNNRTRTFVTASGFVTSPMIVLESIYVPDERGAGVTGVEAAVSTLPDSPPGIAGLLGQSFLRHFHVTIDAERGVMHLQPMNAPAGARP